MNSASEQQRQIGNAIRFGTISEVDLAAARCRVESGDVHTDWLPWILPRAGNTIEWSAPTVGEQVILLCQDGDTMGGAVLRGIYSDHFAAPSDSEDLHLVRYPDGAVVQYDHAAHSLKAMLPSGGTAEITADGGVTVNGNVTINGDVQVSGTVTASDDVIADGISLTNHKHPGVQSGGSQTGTPV